LRISVSGKFGADTFDCGFAAANIIREIARSEPVQEIETELSIVFFPVIFSDRWKIQRKSHRSYSSKEQAEFVNVEIEANSWSQAEASLQLNMMFDALIQAVQETPPKRLPDATKTRVIKSLQSAFESHKKQSQEL
jgi:hypothetical protein